MTLLQFIYKTILLLFVLHTTVKLHTVIMNLLPLMICLFVVLLLYHYMWPLTNMVSADLTKMRVRIHI